MTISMSLHGMFFQTPFYLLRSIYLRNNDASSMVVTDSDNSAPQVTVEPLYDGFDRGGNESGNRTACFIARAWPSASSMNQVLSDVGVFVWVTI